VHLVVSANGKSVPLSPGLSGGYPAATQWDVLVRGSTVAEQFAAGRIPRSLDELGGTPDILPPHLETDLAPSDVYFTHWQGGGGIGDPLHREPEIVARDVADGKVSATSAHDVYGVVLEADGSADVSATEQRRHELRHRRAGLTPEGVQP